MAGDTIQICVKGFYKSTAASTSRTTASAMITSILQAFSGSSVVEGVHTGSGAGSPITMFKSSTYDQLKQQDPSQNLSDKPKAYLSYVLFDEQFNLVSANSGVRRFREAPTYYKRLQPTDLQLKKQVFFIFIHQMRVLKTFISIT